jgi:tetratricopeptide (TPR) repeat protein
MPGLFLGIAWAIAFFLVASPGAQAGVLDQGVKAAQRQDYPAAVQYFTEAIQQSDRPEAAYRHRCLMHLLLDDPAQAAMDCTYALERRPDAPQALFYRGLAYYRLADYPAAIADFTQHLQRRPKDGQAYYNRGLAVFATHDAEAAIADYRRALETVALRPEEQAEIYNDLGVAYLAIAQPDLAMTALNQAIALNEKDPRAYFNRGCICHHQGDMGAALANFEQVLTLDPRNAETYLNRGLVKQELGDHTGAIADLETAMQYFRQQDNPQGAQKAKLRLQQFSHHISAVG